MVNGSRNIYFLPNLLTTAALFAGFYGIVAATQDQFQVAAAAIFVAAVMDGLDGRVARLLNAQSEFGAQYDSIADMVSFGVAPALIMFEWSLSSMQNLSFSYAAKLGWLAAFVYVACAGLRLARFNVQVGSIDKRFFMGLASPASAAVVMGLIWVVDDIGVSGAEVWFIALPLTVICALMMVSRFMYYSFKDLGSKTRGRVPFFVMVLLILIFAFVSFDPPKVLFAFFFSYLLSGPLLSGWRRLRRRRRQTTSD